jgi:hypothetical protein
MSILEEMSCDDLNMYYSDTYLSIKSDTQIKPFYIRHFESTPEEGIVVIGKTTARTRAGKFVERDRILPVNELLPTIPEVGYVDTVEGETWIELVPSNRGYKKGLRVQNIPHSLGGKGLWNLYNVPYYDFIINSRTVIYKGVSVGTITDNKFNPAHPDYEYLEDYINEEINR